MFIARYTLTIEVRDLSGDPLGCEVSLSPPSSTFGDGESYVYDESPFCTGGIGGAVGEGEGP